jgi:putative tricarboxylic transport membrane protein
MWASILRLPHSILLALITLFMLIGAYSVNNSTLDLVVLVIMGVVGFVFRKVGFDLAPLVLALVLGPFLERSFAQSLIISHGDPMIFANRPISGLLTAGLILLAALPWLRRLFLRASPEKAGITAKADRAHPVA